MKPPRAASPISITEARRMLPGLIQTLGRSPERVFRISVRRRVVAELKAPPRISKAGLAARRLMALAPRGTRRRTSPILHVSEDVDRHLY